MSNVPNMIKMVERARQTGDWAQWDAIARDVTAAFDAGLSDELAYQADLFALIHDLEE